jgi:thiol-disulfide isomerase/thioredoxin
MSPERRRNLLIFGAVGAGAVVAGVAGGLWRERQQLQAARQTEALDEAALAAHGGLWGMSFPQPDGRELVMAAFRGRPLVINFWATWCPPCVKEMPELDRFQREFAGDGWQVVGLAIDGPTPVRQFLEQVPVSFAIGLAGFGGTELAKALGNSRGGLPFTAVFNAKGQRVQTKMGETDFAELSTWARSVMHGSAR